VFAALLSSALGAAAGKTLFPLVGAEGVTALRLGFSAVILAWIGKPWRQALNGPMLATIAAYGISLGLMNILIYQAFARLPLGVAVAVEVTGPMAVALFCSGRAADIAWLATAATGLALLIPFRTDDPIDLVDLLFAAGAATCRAFYIVFGRKFADLMPARATQEFS
jgi:inner membrane transporter RhtA